MSSRIENYPGFPGGLSGQELAEAAYEQAVGFGAEILVGSESVTGQDRRGRGDRGRARQRLGRPRPLGDRRHRLPLPPAGCRGRGRVHRRGRLLRRVAERRDLPPRRRRLRRRRRELGRPGGAAPGGARALGHPARPRRLDRGGHVAVPRRPLLHATAGSRCALEHPGRARERRREARAIVVESDGEEEELPADALFILIGGTPVDGELSLGPRARPRTASSSPAPTSRTRGRSTARRTSSSRASPGSSSSATPATARSSASRPRSARARWRCSRCTATWPDSTSKRGSPSSGSGRSRAAAGSSGGAAGGGGRGRRPRRAQAGERRSRRARSRGRAPRTGSSCAGRWGRAQDRACPRSSAAAPGPRADGRRSSRPGRRGSSAARPPSGRSWSGRTGRRSCRRPSAAAALADCDRELHRPEDVLARVRVDLEVGLRADDLEGVAIAVDRIDAAELAGLAPVPVVDHLVAAGLLRGGGARSWPRRRLRRRRAGVRV